MPSFRNMAFGQRYAVLGDTAEAVFEEVWSKPFERYGIKRPRVRVSSIPLFVRAAPDYFDGDGFIEVMGFGRDQTVKLKHAKHEVLLEYQAKWDVRIFLWDSSRKCWSVACLSDVEEALVNEGWEDAFDDGPEYVALKAAHWPGIWTSHVA